MRWMTVAAGLMLAGCASSTEPTQAELKARWEADNIPPVNYKSDLLAYMRTYLNDPTHVRGASVSQPFRMALPGNPGERFLVCVRYDARKSDGAYGGMKTGAAAFKAGRLDFFYDNQRETPQVCKDAAYEPFPELQNLSR
jgi:hypothetical protein